MKYCEQRKETRKWKKHDSKRNSHHRAKGRKERARIVVIETKVSGTRDFRRNGDDWGDNVLG